MGKPQRRFGKEFEAEAVRLCATSGQTQKAVAEDLGVGWATSARLYKELALSAMRRAIVVRRPAAGLIHHADRGSQWRTPFQAVCDAWKGVPSAFSLNPQIRG